MYYRLIVTKSYCVKTVLVSVKVMIFLVCPGLPLDTVLEVFGEFFFAYCYQHGYDKMLKTLGEDFETFIQNLDSLHALLALSYKSLVPPSFR